MVDTQSTTVRGGKRDFRLLPFVDFVSPEGLFIFQQLSTVMK